MLKQSLKTDSFTQKISDVLKKDLDISRALFARKGFKKYFSSGIFKKAGI